MIKMFAAFALALALPASAYAQAAPSSAPDAEEKRCGEKLDMKMDCCAKHRDASGGDGEHAGHDVSQHQQHQQHQKPNQ